MIWTEAWAGQLVHDAWRRPHPPRSLEYRAGMVAGARGAMGLAVPVNPHRAGTTAADAWWAGVQEGRALVAVWEYCRAREAVEALPALMARGRLPEPESVAKAKHAFLVASDPVRAWLAERADLGSGWVLRTVLASDLKRWAERNDMRTMSAQELYARLDTVTGLRPVTIGGHRGYRGLTLKAGEDE